MLPTHEDGDRPYPAPGKRKFRAREPMRERAADDSSTEEGVTARVLVNSVTVSESSRGGNYTLTLSANRD